MSASDSDIPRQWPVIRARLTRSPNQRYTVEHWVQLDLQIDAANNILASIVYLLVFGTGLCINSEV
jgi:hypothetical protein